MEKAEGQGGHFLPCMQAHRQVPGPGVLCWERSLSSGAVRLAQIYDDQVRNHKAQELIHTWIFSQRHAGNLGGFLKHY